MSDGTLPNTLIHRDQGGMVETFESGSTLDIKDGATLKLNGDTSGLASTSTEINTRTDDSAMEQTIIAAGALGVSVASSKLAVVGGGAVTLAAPTKPAFTKVIKMTTDDGDVTLALTNVVGGTQATTATFSAVGQTLILVSDVSGGKWVVTKEYGVVLS